MKFMDRLMYFGFGTALGCVMVYFMLLKDRDFPAWLPGDRIIEEIGRATLVIPEDVVLPFADSLLPEAVKRCDVLFRESDVRNKPCREYELDSEEERMRVRICDTVATVLNYRKK